MDWSAPSIEELIDRLGLDAHPEGGWFKRTWAHPLEHEGRPLATSINFLLPEGVTTRWHRVDADELWLYHHGAPLDLSVVGGDRATGDTGDAVGTVGTVGTVTVGPVTAVGQHAQHTVPAGAWQSATSLGRYTLVTCVVVPGFVWEGFELAPEGWTPDRDSAP